jgi:NAD(P)-dependent dehydrogenase (short-subunit alcohol dehydrogenase family)
VAKLVWESVIMAGTILRVGANRGLGLGLAREYLKRGWDVVATARSPGSASDLVRLEGKLRVEAMDMSHPQQAAELAKRLHGTPLDVLFIVAGQNKAGVAPIHAASPDVAAGEFLVNSYAPPVAAEALLGLLKPGGTVVFMTSVLGSLARSQGGMELYNASKAALNMLAIGFAKRHPDRRVILMHPGWVKTDMGGDGAPLDVETSARGMADTVAARAAGTGVVYVDYANDELPW